MRTDLLQVVSRAERGPPRPKNTEGPPRARGGGDAFERPAVQRLDSSPGTRPRCAKAGGASSVKASRRRVGVVAAAEGGTGGLMGNASGGGYADRFGRAGRSSGDEGGGGGRPKTSATGRIEGRSGGPIPVEPHRRACAIGWAKDRSLLPSARRAKRIPNATGPSSRE